MNSIGLETIQMNVHRRRDYLTLEEFQSGPESEVNIWGDSTHHWVNIEQLKFT